MMLRVSQMRVFCFFKQKTAYEMRISDWSSNVCSSDLHPLGGSLLPDLRRAPTLGTGARVVNGRDGRDGEPERHDLYTDGRSEERRVGKECVSTCRSRWSPHHEKKKHNNTRQVAS